MGGSTDESRRLDAPGPEFWPAAYWFWSRIPTSDEARAQLSELAASGFSTVLIQPRLSFARERYLSEEYLHGYRGAVEIAAELGLTVGIYDEYGWISGHGGGLTVAGADELRERHLFWSTSSVRQPLVTRVSEIHSEWIDGLGGAEREWLYDGGVRKWADWDLVCALARPPRSVGERNAIGDWIDVSPWAMVIGAADGATTLIAEGAPIPAGWIVTVFVSARCASSRLINYLDPRAAQRFIETVYDRYAEACAGLLGDPIRYFQFDHPYGGFYGWRERDGEVGNALMWLRGDAWKASLVGDATSSISRELDGAALSRLLLSVIYDTGDAGKLARAGFFERYARSGIESFFGQLSAWARAHGVGLTGHEYLAHVGGWDLNGGFPAVDGRTNFGLDYFAIDSHRSETLVDACNYGEQLSPRFGDSVARAHGRSRCTVEQYASRDERPGHYAGGYWELGLGELRMAALRQHLLGARQFLIHAYGQSDGDDSGADVLRNPRFDFPPAINFEPWFEHFHGVASELAEVSAFIDGARPLCSIALVYPLHTVWAEGPRHIHSRLVGEWARLLSRWGVGFDLVDDRDLAAAENIDGTLRIGAHRYRSVILAGATVLPAASAVDALEKLVAAGGTVLLTPPLPTLSLANGSDPGLATRLAALCSVEPDPIVPETPPGQIMNQMQTLALDSDPCPGTLWQWAGRDDEGLRVVLLNDSTAERCVTMRAAGHCAAFVVRGDENELRPSRSLMDDRTEVRLRMEPEAVLCLKLVVREPFSWDLQGDWTLSVDDGEPVQIAVDRGWEQQGFETFCGVGTYRCRFDLPKWLREGYDDGKLRLPRVHCAVRAQLNGVELGVRTHRPFEFDLPSELLRNRSNELVLEVTNSAANRYYAGTSFAGGELQPSGLSASPVLLGFRGLGAPPCPTRPAVRANSSRPRSGAATRTTDSRSPNATVAVPSVRR